MPLVPETKGMIGEAVLRTMKRTAYLINSARGSVVDQAALIQVAGGMHRRGRPGRL
jgi:phosphoglycerate dehydrogenase-like enzyme